MRPRTALMIALPVVVAVAAFAVLRPEEDVAAPTAAVPSASHAQVRPLSAEQLDLLLAQKGYAEDFFLLDTHIPEQEHIPGTDAFIPFNEIALRADELPADKDAKIVVYCRSGNMSAQAAEALVKLGYTQVYDLTGGIKAYNAL